MTTLAKCLFFGYTPTHMNSLRPEGTNGLPEPTYKPPQRTSSGPQRPTRLRSFLWLAAALFATVLLVFTALTLVKTVRENNRVGSVRVPNEIHDPVTPSLDPKAPESLFGRLKQLVFSGNRATLMGEKDDRINILLLGMGGLGHEGPYLTDTNILVSVKPSTKEVGMVSIPRDLGVDIPEYGPQKINHANHWGELENANHGAALATQVVQQTFDVPVPYYARIDFMAFRELIDLVGGVTIDVERTFVDEEYPAPNEEYQVVSFSKGIQTMDGATALKYARSRHGNNGEGSDFARSVRQQKVILALKEKLLSFETLANPVRLAKIVKTLDTHLTTNMEFEVMLSFLELAKEFGTNKITRLTLDDSEGGYLQPGRNSEGSFVLEPRTGDFADINAAIANIFESGTLTVDNTPEQIAPAFTPAVIEIQNGTWRVGLATRVRKLVEDKKLDVERVGNTSERPKAESGIYVLSDLYPEDVIEVLSKTLHLEVKPRLPEGETAHARTEVLVILGDDFIE